MGRKSSYYSLKAVEALNIQAISTDTTTVGNVIDTQGFESITFTAQTGVVTDGDYEFQVFADSAVGMGTEAVVDTAAKGLIGTVPDWEGDDDDNKIHQFGVAGGTLGVLRYMRVKVVSTNTSTGATVGCLAVMGDAIHRPVTATEET